VKSNDTRNLSSSRQRPVLGLKTSGQVFQHEREKIGKRLFLLRRELSQRSDPCRCRQGLIYLFAHGTKTVTISLSFCTRQNISIINITLYHYYFAHGFLIVSVILLFCARQITHKMQPKYQHQ